VFILWCKCTEQSAAIETRDVFFPKAIPSLRAWRFSFCCHFFFICALIQLPNKKTEYTVKHIHTQLKNTWWLSWHIDIYLLILIHQVFPSSSLQWSWLNFKEIKLHVLLSLSILIMSFSSFFPTSLFCLSISVIIRRWVGLIQLTSLLMRPGREVVYPWKHRHFTRGNVMVCCVHLCVWGESSSWQLGTNQIQPVFQSFECVSCVYSIGGSSVNWFSEWNVIWIRVRSASLLKGFLPAPTEHWPVLTLSFCWPARQPVFPLKNQGKIISMTLFCCDFSFSLFFVFPGRTVLSENCIVYLKI